ncbi:hypothetical protein GA0070622_0648 [Micromonospora sediminicola]|uniref:Hpr(Ser) kinase/phosphatase n=1 Tax=Micromonospora sediminicola TaxID=946078 RepID=A0A1A9B2G3_9ACTN|nr:MULTISPECIES: hypothetical protein [Micromonospora]PGH41745.1 hypothetical protein COO58_24745 [Micromonospora sp. WMMA1996]SBT63690.1 hypothetical protein GA0070622_0648 [Micromonospora sediminicola]
MTTELPLRSTVGGYRLVGAEQHVRRLAWLAAPFFHPAPADPATAWLVELTGPTTATGLPAAPTQPPHSAHWVTAARTLRIECPSDTWLPLIALRYLRTIDRAQALTRGAIPLHGAAVTAAGRGIVLVGNKRAGKTTAALSLVRSLDGRLVSNDDALLWSRAPGWVVTGGPRSTGIRLSSLPDHMPSLSPAALAKAAHAHPANGSVPDKTFLLTAEATALGCRLAPEARVDAIIELDAVAEVAELRRLDEDEAATMLNRHRELSADRRRRELLADLGDPAPRRAASVIAADVACYRYAHPRHGWLPDFITALDRVGSEQVPARER